MMKNYIILSFIILFAFLLFFILSGRFCHCSSVYCPHSDDLGSVIS